MSTCIIAGFRINESNKPAAALYCNTSGQAFGPLFADADEAADFLSWLPCDPRKVDDLAQYVADFRYQAEARANSEHESSGGKFGLRSPVPGVGYLIESPAKSPASWGELEEAERFSSAAAADARRKGRMILNGCTIERLPL